jgi:hypothetical protein
MLNPSRLRKNLREFLLSHTDDTALFVKQNTTRTRRTLIQGHQILCHRYIPFKFEITEAYAPAKTKCPTIKNTDAITLYLSIYYKPSFFHLSRNKFKKITKTAQNEEEYSGQYD